MKARAKALSADGLTQYWVVASGAELVALADGCVPEAVKKQACQHLHRSPAESRAEHLVRMNEATEAEF